MKEVDTKILPSSTEEDDEEFILSDDEYELDEANASHHEVTKLSRHTLAAREHMDEQASVVGRQLSAPAATAKLAEHGFNFTMF